MGSWVGAFSALSEARLAAPGISLCPSRPFPPHCIVSPFPMTRSVGSIIGSEEGSAQPSRHPEASRSTGHRSRRPIKEVPRTGLPCVRPWVSGRPLSQSSSHPPPGAAPPSPPPPPPTPPPGSGPRGVSVPAAARGRHFLKGPQPDSGARGGAGLTSAHARAASRRRCRHSDRHRCPGGVSLKLGEVGALCDGVSESGLRPVLARASPGWSPEAGLAEGGAAGRNLGRSKRHTDRREEAARDPSLRRAWTVCR